MASASASASTANVAVITRAVRVKDIMAIMPDTLTNKEVDEYYKKAMKDVDDKIKKENNGGKAPRKALAVKAAPKKGVKKQEVDKDGNDIEKEKKPLNAYQKFIQDNRQKVKDDNPNMTGVEIFTLLAEKWVEHKKTMNAKENDKEDKSSGKSSPVAVAAVVSPAVAVAVVSCSNKSDDFEITEDKEDQKKKVHNKVFLRWHHLYHLLQYNFY